MRFKFLILSILISFNLFSQIDKEDFNIEVRDLNDFTQLVASRGVNVTFVQGLQPKAEVQIKNSSPENVVTEQKGEVVTIRMKANNDKNISVNVFVSLGMNKIEKINIGTGARVYSETILKNDNLEIEMGAGSVAELDIDVDKVSLNISSSSAQLLGKAKSIDIKATVGSNVETTELKVDEAKVSANLGSNVVVYVKKELNAKSFSGARIAYCGETNKVVINQSLGGKIEQFK